jgi:cytochrome bd-type quinol oxidase subunit 2
MDAYSIIKQLHSGFRYIVFILVVVAIIQSLLGWLGKKPYTEVNRKTNLFALISAHTQLLIGIVLYFKSPYVQFNSDTMKNDTTRYFTVEHWVMMLIAIVLITIGYSKSKKKVLPEQKHKTIVIFYLIAFLVIIGAIMAGHLPVFGSKS